MSHLKQKPVSYWDHIPPESSVVSEPEAVYMIEKVRDGLPFTEFHTMQEMLGVTEERLGAWLGMSRATLHRRKKAGSLDSAASDRLVRYAPLMSHATAALGGVEGARLYGRRWNLPGVAAVYLAESRALAALEILVHAPREALRLNWSVIELEIPDSLIERAPLSKLPETWRSHPSSHPAQTLGSRWLRDYQNLALSLPSVVIPEENSLLLNPLHPAMRDLKPAKPVPFSFDSRPAG